MSGYMLIVLVIIAKKGVGVYHLAELFIRCYEKMTEKAMATHSSTLAWKIPDRGPSWATVHGASKSWTRLSK